MSGGDESRILNDAFKWYTDKLDGILKLPWPNVVSNQPPEKGR